MCNKNKKNTDIVKNCDCSVGFLCGDPINKSTIDYEVERLIKSQSNFKKYGILNGEPETKHKIVDGRKGYLSRYTYCPKCGEKINWKQVLSNC